MSDILETIAESTRERVEKAKLVVVPELYVETKSNGIWRDKDGQDLYGYDEALDASPRYNSYSYRS